MTIQITNSSQETEEFGQEVAKRLKPGTVLALYGDLGSGKTTFTKGLAKGLGITDRITSPTFIIMRDYDLPSQDNARLHHLDLYRMKSDDDLKSLDLNELINEEKNIFVIEWAEKADQESLKNAIKISFEVTGDTTRKITINP